MPPVFGRLAESSAAGSVTRRVILRIRIFPELPGEGTEISGEERKKRAADYALSILEEAEVASAEQEGGYQDPLYGAADWFAVRMKDGYKVTLAVQKSSGLILNVSILPQNP